MYKKNIEYKSAGDVLGAIKQSFRRFSIDKLVLVSIEEQYLENELYAKNLVFSNGLYAIRITDIEEYDMNKLSDFFSVIETPCKYLNDKWYFIDEDPMYCEDILKRLEEKFSKLI